MESRLIKLTCFFLSILLCAWAKRGPYVINESWVCAVKVSCSECLKLSQCLWCAKENKCFSKTLETMEETCSNNTVELKNYGFSIVENAECSCNIEMSQQNCYPPESSDKVECSGRGICVCGRCVCNSDPENPSKMIMGEYCEYDNFSCEGPKCAEGPYHISQVYENDGSFKTYQDV